MNILFIGTPDDENYLHRLKPLFGGATVSATLAKINTWTEVMMHCKNKGISSIVSTSPSLLHKVSGIDDTKIDDYSGSLFNKNGIEVLFIDPLRQLITVSYGPFIAERYISKLTNKQFWDRFPATPFDWAVLETQVQFEAAEKLLSHCEFIAVDIETTPSGEIFLISYTGARLQRALIDGWTWYTKTYVFEIKDEFSYTWMKRFNALHVPKGFQNGKYDNAYFAKYSAPCWGWYWDTANMFHCWYAELPKDLGSLGAFHIRDCIYWKDMGKSTDMKTQMEYCGRDTWGTANVILRWFYEAPAWAKKNYLMEFPLNFPCHLTEMIGIKRNPERVQKAKAEAEAEIAEKSKSLDIMTGTKNFNVKSNPQMTALFKILGCGDLPGTGKIPLDKAKFRHPLNNYILEQVQEVRNLRTRVSTFLTTGDKAKEYRGRMLYALNPHGTDTGRLASNSHHFWCGLNIQNQPRGKQIKQTYEADPGFLFGELDLKQNESWHTAHIAGEENMIVNLSGGKDFHSLNASQFFGLRYDQIWSDEKQEAINTPVRQVSKNTNHGANYLMGPDVMVDTMGLKAVYKAQALLSLDKHWKPRHVTGYLLERFHKTYPALQKHFYPWVIESVTRTRMLVDPWGWTRYCFGNPKDNKRDLNSYVAHMPQGFAARVLNKMYMRMFYEITLKHYPERFKPGPQIHDSIMFQFKAGFEYLADEVARCMRIQLTVTGCDGKTRTYVVPVDTKLGKDGKGAQFWSDTE